MTNLLKFRPNSKILKTGKAFNMRPCEVSAFAILAGHTCPGAKDCLAKVMIEEMKRKLIDGKHSKFRCFAATSEVGRASVFNAHKHNTDLLQACKSKEEMAKLIIDSIITNCSKHVKLIRVHWSGDFFSQMYFDAWLLVAEQMPHIRFYAYTKSLNFWKRREYDIPNNLFLTASRGGRYDHLIGEIFADREAVVVFSEEEAEQLGLPIDYDDTHAAGYGGDFALLIHGNQPSGSDAQKAWRKVVQDIGKGIKSIA